MKIKTKTGAIELSIGTVVIIVLAMSMLILGIVLIRNIFDTATGAIKATDRGINEKINQLFSAEEDKVIVVYPDTAVIPIKKGTRDTGFAVAVRNTGDSFDTFTINVGDPISSECADPSKFKIVAGKNTPAIGLNGREPMENPVYTIFSIPDPSQYCVFSVHVDVTSSSGVSQKRIVNLQVTD